MNVRGAEVEANTGGGVYFRDGFHIPKLQGILVACQSCRRIVSEIAPHSDRTKLRHSIFDVIERNLIQVQLLLPQVVSCRLKSLPSGHLIGKASEYFIPCYSPV